MAFWIGILVAGIFVWLAYNLGFYQSWALAFNIVISVYVAVFLGPVIADFVPGAGDTPYSDILGMLVAGGGAFLILHTVSYTFLTGQFNMTFPRLFDSLGSGILGLLAGYLVWSFAGLLICTTPISDTWYAEALGFSKQSQSQQTNLKYLGWWCDRVHTLTAMDAGSRTAQDIIDELLRRGQEKFGTESSEPTPSDTGGP